MTADAAISILLVGLFGVLELFFAYAVWHQRLPGRPLWFARWYHHQYLAVGAPWRNGAFAAVPFGIALLLVAVAGLLPPILPTADSADRLLRLILVVCLGLLLLSLLGLTLLALAAFVRPPRWLKPRWLRQEETRLEAGLPSLVPLPPEGDRPVLRRWDRPLIVVMSAVVLAGVLLLRWPPALLVGIGIGLQIFGRAGARDQSAFD